MKTLNGFERHNLDQNHEFWTGQLPAELRLTSGEFEELWHQHPKDYQLIAIHGQKLKTPRWQQAYVRDYRFAGQTNQALPMLSLLEPILAWMRSTIHKGLNGLLINWYDGAQAHYIGRHRDSTDNLVADSPIVTVSFGEERTFRLRPWRAAGYRDFQAFDGSIFILPSLTNLNWTHEVPHFAGQVGRRVSVTFRAFATQSAAPHLTASQADYNK